MIDIAKYEKILRAELETLETELKSVGHVNADNPGDWESDAKDVDVNASDETDIADNINAYESNTALLKQFEVQYNEVKAALERIKKGTYGICEVSGKPIEKKRLDANPAARTCIAHKNDTQ
jgi:RNA polymerase-binding transcription factor DksA